MSEILPERWYIWYLLEEASARARLVERMRQHKNLLRNLPPEPVLSGPAVAVLRGETQKRLASRLAADIRKETVWILEPDGTVQAVTVRSPRVLASLIVPDRDTWRFGWNYWLHALEVNPAGPDPGESSGLAAYLFDLDTTAHGHWMQDVADWMRLGRGEVVPERRRERLLSFSDYRTWAFPVRAAAVTAVPYVTSNSETHVVDTVRVDEAYRWWTGAGVTGYEDGSTLERLAAQARVQTAERSAIHE